MIADGVPRLLHPGAFAAFDASVVVCDEVLPVVVEFTLQGQLVAKRTWTLDAAYRSRPTATDVVLSPTSIVVASPAAGGLVRIDRATGAAALIRFPQDIGALVRDGETVYAIADPDREGAYEGFLESPDRRAVIWEEPSAADMERHRTRMAGWFHRAPDSDDEWVPAVDPDEPPPRAADWRSVEDDEAEHIGPPTPVWRIEGSDVSSVDFGGEVEVFAALNGIVVGVCQRPSDPLVKAVQPGGYLSYFRPGSVVVSAGDRFEVAAQVPETGGEILIEGDSAWLLGFARERDREATELRHLKISARELSDPIELSGEEIALVAGRAVTRVRTRRDESLVIRSLADRSSVELPIPSFDDRKSVDGPRLWLREDNRATLLCVDVLAAQTHLVDAAIDVSDFLPEVSPPPGFDTSAFEAEQRDNLRGAFFGGWQSEAGDESPYIDGVTFESVELVGSFPNTAVVALYRSSDHPGFKFGTRWRLYDDLGNPEDLEYADIGLMENIEADGFGLPPLRECVPDDDGVVWFDDW